jgi:hypothetical protein
MTAGEVKNAVALLGFNPELSDEEEHARFWAALHMATEMLSQYAPVERSEMIAHYPIAPSYVHHAVLDKPYLGEVEVVVPGAAGLYFEVIGTGEAELMRDGFTHHIAWEGLRTFEPRRFIVPAILGERGNVRIRFYGEYAYSVRHLCGYDTLLSPDARELAPPRDWYAYDISERVDDFGGFAPDIVWWDEPSRSIGYRIVSRSVIELDAASRGVVYVRYRHAPRRADADHEDEQIDIEPTLHHLIPLLVAHYLWMDDEPQKAAQYKANYDEQLALWRLQARPTAAPRVVDVNGWV